MRGLFVDGCSLMVGITSTLNFILTLNHDLNIVEAAILPLCLYGLGWKATGVSLLRLGVEH